MVKTPEPQDFESTGVCSPNMADSIWGFADMRLRYVHTEIANEADDFAIAFFPL